MGMGGIIDFLFVLSGAYLVGSALMAKRQGSVAANVMLGKNMEEKDIEDKAGFVEYMSSRLLLAGVLMLVAGLIHLANDYYFHMTLLSWIGIFGVIGALAVYINAYRNGQRRYMKRWLEKQEKQRQLEEEIAKQMKQRRKK